VRYFGLGLLSISGYFGDFSLVNELRIDFLRAPPFKFRQQPFLIV
jgi:hypothetical protein